MFSNPPIAAFVLFVKITGHNRRYLSYCKDIDRALQKLPHLDEVLSELKQRGFKLGVITNTVTSREEHVRIALRRIDCEKYFDVIVTSVDAGCNKPDEKIFLTALKAVNVKPEEAMMVGNQVSNARARDTRSRITERVVETCN
jgi:HAD superfamily hydrolase (TIGR01549 family)